MREGRSYFQDVIYRIAGEYKVLPRYTRQACYSVTVTPQECSPYYPHCILAMIMCLLQTLTDYKYIISQCMSNLVTRSVYSFPAFLSAIH